MDSLTDREIMKASDAIDKALASSNRSNRGEVSVRILSLVRNLNDNIAEKIWCDLHPDKPRSVNKVGKEFINVPSYRFIGKFYNYLGKSVSHFTPTEDGAERLMLKYYQYVLQLKEVMSVRYNTEILKNINLFILDTDQKTQDYYNKVAEQIVHIDDTAISSSADNYYVNRVKPFVSNNKVYYEITLEPALGKPNKFNRITAFTKYNIFSNYSVALKFVDTYINIFGVNFPIKIISDWSVSIRPCEINNFAAILNMNVNIQRGNIEYRVMMEYLKEHQVSLVEIVDYGQEQYMKLKNEVIFSTPARHSYFFDILDQCRLYSKKRRPGKNILRLLLNRMNNEIIKDQWPYKNGKTYVLICDNDNVSFDNSKPGGVLGTPGFMAPEIVRGEKRPSKDTDRYSLSVLLFYLFMVNHPLEGKLEASIRCMDMAARVKLYGTDPVFIFDPNNKTNRPVKGIHDNATIYWPLYPEKLRQMFTRAFTVGLNEPSKRITEPEWMTLFSNMMSGMLQCSCGAQLFYDEDLETKGVAHTCWNCGKTIQVPNKIIIGKNRVLLHQNTKLLHHHVYDDFDMDTVVGSVVQNPKNPALWGIRNEDKVNWTYQKADGTQIPVAPGKTAGIAKGVKILFPESTGEFR